MGVQQAGEENPEGMWVAMWCGYKGWGEQPGGRAAAPALEMLVGQGKAICFIKGFEAQEGAVSGLKQFPEADCGL